MLEAVNLCKVFFQLCVYIGSFVGTELYTVVICYITSPFYIRVCAQLLIMIQRGQASCPVIRIQVQTSCNFKASISNCSCVLGCFLSRSDNGLFESPYNLVVSLPYCGTLWSYVNLLLHENFPYSSSSPDSRTR